MVTIRGFSLVGACAGLLIALMAGGAGRVDAGEVDQRAGAGVRLFRSLLAADLDLGSKTLDDGRLLIVFLHAGDSERARELASVFRGSASDAGVGIRGLPIVVEFSRDASLGGYESRRPAGIFIAEPPGGSKLRAVIRYGIDRGIIVYSPFEGHVESGVLGGVSVEAQVRPYINTRTLQASHISLKSFFMKVTKSYP